MELSSPGIKRVSIVYLLLEVVAVISVLYSIKITITDSGQVNWWIIISGIFIWMFWILIDNSLPYISLGFFRLFDKNVNWSNWKPGQLHKFLIKYSPKFLGLTISLFVGISLILQYSLFNNFKNHTWIVGSVVFATLFGICYQISIWNHSVKRNRRN